LKLFPCPSHLPRLNLPPLHISQRLNFALDLAHSVEFVRETEDFDWKSTAVAFSEYTEGGEEAFHGVLAREGKNNSQSQGEEEEEERRGKKGRTFPR
jgi:hypothetical protein